MDKSIKTNRTAELLRYIDWCFGKAGALRLVMAQLVRASVAKEWKIYRYPVLGFGNVCVHPSMREVDETAGMGRVQRLGWWRDGCGDFALGCWLFSRE